MEGRGGESAGWRSARRPGGGDLGATRAGREAALRGPLAGGASLRQGAGAHGASQRLRRDEGRASRRGRVAGGIPRRAPVPAPAPPHRPASVWGRAGVKRPRRRSDSRVPLGPGCAAGPGSRDHEARRRAMHERDPRPPRRVPASSRHRHGRFQTQPNTGSHAGDDASGAGVRAGSAESYRLKHGFGVTRSWGRGGRSGLTRARRASGTPHVVAPNPATLRRMNHGPPRPGRHPEPLPGPAA